MGIFKFKERLRLRFVRNSERRFPTGQRVNGLAGQWVSGYHWLFRHLASQSNLVGECNLI